MVVYLYITQHITWNNVLLSLIFHVATAAWHLFVWHYSRVICINIVSLLSAWLRTDMASHCGFPASNMNTTQYYAHVCDIICIFIIYYIFIIRFIKLIFNQVRWSIANASKWKIPFKLLIHNNVTVGTMKKSNIQVYCFFIDCIPNLHNII